MSPQAGVLPDTNDLEFAPFWAATREHRIEVPACGNGHLVWPPRPLCPRCLGSRFTWTPVASTGTLYTWTTVHQPTVASMPGPYIVAIVEIDGGRGLRLLGNIWDVDPAALTVGMPLRAKFDSFLRGSASDAAAAYTEASADAAHICTLVNWTPAS